MGRVFRKAAIIAAVVWLFVDALWHRFYQDVAVCFTPGTATAQPQFITIHHDGINRPTTLDEINRYHRDTCHWDSGLAYHYYISENKIYKIRDERQRGTHVLDGNTGNIGICVHGNFNDSRPTLTQQILIIILINKLCYQFEIKKQNIKRHQDWANNPTSCCGNNFDLETMLKYIHETK